MHLIRQIFRKAQHRSGNDHAVYLESRQMRLPPELILLIISFIEQKGDLALLCRVSRYMGALCAPLLYRVIEIGGDCWIRDRGIEQLSKAIKRQCHSNPVTEISIHSFRRPRRIPSPGQYRDDPKQPNACEKFDRKLGNFLKCLQNLKILRIRCHCYDPKHNHDSLLDNLPIISQLESFEFTCLGHRLRKPSDFFLSLMPMLRNITTLELFGGPEWPEACQQLLGDPTVLPKLRTLYHCGKKFSNALVAARCVEVLYLRTRSEMMTSSADIHDAISRSPGRLLRLYSPDGNDFLWFGMSIDAQPYRHLRDINTIQVGSIQEAEILDNLKILRPLKQLESIKMRWGRKYTGFDLSPYFFAELEQRHPKLHWILLDCNIHHPQRFGFSSYVSWKKSLDGKAGWDKSVSWWQGSHTVGFEIPEHGLEFIDVEWTRFVRNAQVIGCRFNPG